MGRQLSDQQIEQVCRDLLASRRRVTVRAVMARLRAALGAVGRTERVAAILSRLASEGPPLPMKTSTASEESAGLREKLRVAEERADLAEMRERRHQDFWAARYQDKVEELQRLHAAQLRAATESAAVGYRRVYQQATDLARRLSRYEKVDAGGESGPDSRDGN